MHIDAVRKEDTDEFVKESWRLLHCLARALQVLPPFFPTCTRFRRSSACFTETCNFPFSIYLLQAFNGGNEELNVHAADKKRFGGGDPSTIETSTPFSNLLQEAQQYAEVSPIRVVIGVFALR